MPIKVFARWHLSEIKPGFIDMATKTAASQSHKQADISYPGWRVRRLSDTLWQLSVATAKPDMGTERPFLRIDMRCDLCHINEQN